MLKQAMQNKLIELKEQAAVIWPHVAKRYQFKKAYLLFSEELQDAWAYAYIASNTIDISMKHTLLDPERTISEVVGHELCHIIAPLLYPDIEDAHGTEWQAVMQAMGLAIDPIDLV